MLVLQAVSNKNPQEVRDITVEQETLLIGRDPVAQLGAQIWELPDPERVISRIHARIEYRDGTYHLIDTSTNGVFVNEATEPLGKGREIELKDGDTLTIGDYQIRVSLPALEKEIGVTQKAPSTDLKESETRLDFWDEVAPVRPPASSEEVSPPPPPTFFAEEGPVQEPPETPEIPDDLFAGLEDIGEPSPEQLPSNSETPPSDLILGSPLEEPFLSPAESESTPPPTETAPPSPPPPARQDSLDLQVLQAFLNGAGLEGHIDPKDLPEDIHRSLGVLTRILVRGMMDLLRSRSQIKNELRLSMTILGGVENNPLKFTATVDDALLHLLRPMPGYLAPEEAIQEAVNDLMAHQVAVISGMQAAIKTLLLRFDPKHLEQRMEKLYPVAAHVPLQRQAKLWSLFEQSYEELNRELEEDFLQLFGRLFANAYEEQVERLKREGC